MADKRPYSAALLPVGLVLVVIGTATGRGEATVLGLSAKFWSGFLLALAVVMLFLSIVHTARKSRP